MRAQNLIEMLHFYEMVRTRIW